MTIDKDTPVLNGSYFIVSNINKYWSKDSKELYF